MIKNSQLQRGVGVGLCLLALLVFAGATFATLTGIPVSEGFRLSDARKVSEPLYLYKLDAGRAWDDGPFEIVNDRRFGDEGTATTLAMDGAYLENGRATTSDLKKAGAVGYSHSGVFNIYFSPPAAARADTAFEVTFRARLVGPVATAAVLSGAGILLFSITMLVGGDGRAGRSARDSLLIVFGLAAVAAVWFATMGVTMMTTMNPDDMREQSGVSYNYRLDVPWPFHVPPTNRADALITALVSEDGKPQGPADARTKDIFELGAGRHVMANDELLWFSASDNSDPRTNGRTYEARLLAFLPEWVAIPIVATWVIMFIAGFAARQRGLSGAALQPAPRLVAFLIPAVMLAVVVGYLAWLIRVDALHLYHSPVENDYFVRNEPHRFAGLIRTYPYEGLIVGGSMSQAFYMSDATEIFGMPMLNITVAGSLPRGQTLMAELAFRDRPIKMVIWDYHLSGWHQEPNSMRRQLFPFGLYDPNPIYRLEYAFSLQAWIDANAAMKARRQFDNLPLDEKNKWATRLPFNRDLVGRRYCPRLAEPPEPMIEKNIRQNIRLRMIPLIEKYPDTEFNYFIPPYSGAMHSRLGGIMTDTHRAARIILEELGKYENVRIFDYQAIEPFTADPDMYRDAIHYPAEINRRILHWIKDGRSRITFENIDAHEREVEVRLDEIARQMDEEMIAVCEKRQAGG